MCRPSCPITNDNNPNMAFERHSSVSELSTKSLPTYTHALYAVKPVKSTSMTITVEQSYFSSCSTSPNSSCESFEMYSPPMRSRESSQATVMSATALSAALSSKRTSNASFVSTRFADDHYPLINSISASSTIHSSISSMACAHNTYIRAINSCYNHASTIEREDVAEFLFFNQTLVNILSQHLRFDKQHLQSLLHRPEATSRRGANIHENTTFQASFDGWAKYVHSRSSQHFYSCDMLQTHISSFAPLLVQHLHDEVQCMSSMVTNNILLPDHLENIWATFEKAMSSSLDLQTDAVLLVGCNDKTFNIPGCQTTSQFPKLSRSTATLVRKWHSRKHEAAWRYCSSDFSGRRRLLSI